MRCGGQALGNVVDAYDAFLRDAPTAAALRPEVVLRFGPLPTSKPVLQYLQRHLAARQILIDAGGEWQDAPRLASDVLLADPTLTAQALAAALGGPNRAGSPWLAGWQRLQQRTRAAVAAQVRAFAEPFEGRVFAELAECLPAGATLFASSSMPVRDLDTFFPARERPLRFLANRGANGIDGVVSSALGVSAAGPGPLVLVIGDLALYHDLNGLLAAKRHGLSATLVLINNDGGGIFSFLPQAAHPENFERLFGTPHGLDFRPAAELYGAAFHQPADWADFRAAVRAGVAGAGLTIIEVRTRRDTNVRLVRALARPIAPNIGRMITGWAGGMDAFASPICAHAMKPPFTTISGLMPKNAGFQITRSASFPTSTDPISRAIPCAIAGLIVYLAT